MYLQPKFRHQRALEKGWACPCLQVRLRIHWIWLRLPDQQGKDFFYLIPCSVSISLLRTKNKANFFLKRTKDITEGCPYERLKIKHSIVTCSVMLISSQIHVLLTNIAVTKLFTATMQFIKLRVLIDFPLAATAPLQLTWSIDRSVWGVKVLLYLNNTRELIP